MNGYYEKHRDELPVDCWEVSNDICDAHFHNSFELVYVTSGEIEVFSGGQQFIVSKGQALFSPSYSLHYYKTPHNSRSINLTLPTDIVPSFKTLMKSRRFCEYLYYDKDKSLLALLKQLCTLCKTSCGNTILYKGLTYSILGLMLEKLKTEPYPDSKSRTFSRDVLIYLQENFTLTYITLENSAKHFGYSKSRFSHIFTSTFGYTFYEYLTLLRCRNAAGLIINNNSTLIDAAMNSGFDNMRTFYRCFKKVFNKTPTQYAKENSSFINE